MQALVEFNEYHLKMDMDILAKTFDDANDVVNELEDVLDSRLVNKLSSFVSAVQEVVVYLELLNDADEFDLEQLIKGEENEASYCIGGYSGKSCT